MLKNFKLIIMTSIAMSVLLCGVVRGEILFTGNFESGNLSGWGVQDGKLPGALTVQSEIVRAGNFASKHHIKKCTWNDI